MALPHKLKAFDLFVDGGPWINQVPKLTLPELARNMVEYRGGGMDMPVMVDMGQNEIEFAFTMAGMKRELFDSYGAPTHDAAQLRFAGSYESDDDDGVMAVEVVARGRYKTIGSADAEPGSDSDTEITMTCSYYELRINGDEILAIGGPDRIFRVNGDDRYAERRKALGMS